MRAWIFIVIAVIAVVGVGYLTFGEDLRDIKYK